MKIFLDTEFTGLHQNTTLISLGLVSEDGRTFYAELSGYDHAQVDQWLTDNVISNLEYRGMVHSPALDLEHHNMKAASIIVAVQIKAWLEQFGEVEIWSDCLAYDWVLFCELFGGAMNLPSNIYYIPFDLATLMRVRGIDPDYDREKYSGMSGNKHHALHDAVVIKACYEKATSSENLPTP